MSKTISELTAAYKMVAMMKAGLQELKGYGFHLCDPHEFGEDKQLTSFPCTRCGACCRNIDHIDLSGCLHNGNGVCKYLLANNSCAIYSQRPLICRVEDGYNKVFSKYMSKEEYFQKTAAACNARQDRVGIDIIYRVQLPGEEEDDR